MFTHFRLFIFILTRFKVFFFCLCIYEYNKYMICPYPQQDNNFLWFIIYLYSLHRGRLPLGNVCPVGISVRFYLDFPFILLNNREKSEKNAEKTGILTEQ